MEQYISMGFDPTEVYKAVNKFRTHDAILSYLVSTKSRLVQSHILGPVERRRLEGQPLGLQNVGNTCYLNSLLQSYYMLPAFYKLIMDISPNNQIIRYFQEIFASLTGSISKYTNPSALFLNISKDESGNFDIEQKDIGEFNLRLIERLENAYERPQRSLEVNRSSIFFMLFYGETIQYLKYTQNNNTAVDVKSSVAGQLLLDVSKDNELYAACESELNSTIDNYVTPDGRTVAVQISSFFENLPKILIIQLNRAEYDKETQTSIKNHGTFTFPKILCPARFLHENKEVSSRIYNDSITLEAEIKLRKKKLEDLKSFKGIQDLQSTIKDLSEFVTSQEELLGITERDQMAQMLNKLGNNTQNKIETIENEIQALKQQKESLYDLPELNSLKYYLHSIMVHEGSSEMGHYYCYIFDYFHKKWRMYNDIYVKEVSEDEVFYKSFGGTGTASAYCIMYADISMIEEQGNLPLREFTLGFKGDLYSEWVPQPLKDYVNNLNKQEMGASDDAYYSIIKNEYEKRYEQLTGFLSSKSYKKNKSDPSNYYSLVNSYIFLYSNDEKALANWHLLDMVIRHHTENKSNLVILETSNPKLYQLLSKGGGKLPKNLLITRVLHEKLDGLLKRYKNAYDLLNLMNYVYENIGNLKLVFQGLVYIMSQVNIESNLNIFRVYPIFQLCLLRMISLAIDEINAYNFDKTIALLDYVYFGAQSFLQERGPMQKHILGLLHQISTRINKSMLSSEQLNKLNEFQNYLQNNDLSFFPDMEIRDKQFTDLIEHISKTDAYSWNDFQHTEKVVLRYSEQNKHVSRVWADWVKKYELLKGLNRQVKLSEFVTKV